MKNSHYSNYHAQSQLEEYLIELQAAEKSKNFEVLNDEPHKNKPYQFNIELFISTLNSSVTLLFHIICEIIVSNVYFGYSLLSTSSIETPFSTWLVSIATIYSAVVLLFHSQYKLGFIVIIPLIAGLLLSYSISFVFEKSFLSYNRIRRILDAIARLQQLNLGRVVTSSVPPPKIYDRLSDAYSFEEQIQQKIFVDGLQMASYQQVKRDLHEVIRHYGNTIKLNEAQDSLSSKTNNVVTIPELERFARSLLLIDIKDIINNSIVQTIKDNNQRLLELWSHRENTFNFSIFQCLVQLIESAHTLRNIYAGVRKLDIAVEKAAKQIVGSESMLDEINLVNKARVLSIRDLRSKYELLTTKLFYLEQRMLYAADQSMDFRIELQELFSSFPLNDILWKKVLESFCDEENSKLTNNDGNDKKAVVSIELYDSSLDMQANSTETVTSDSKIKTDVFEDSNADSVSTAVLPDERNAHGSAYLTQIFVTTTGTTEFKSRKGNIEEHGKIPTMQHCLNELRDKMEVYKRGKQIAKSGEHEIRGENSHIIKVTELDPFSEEKVVKWTDDFDEAHYQEPILETSRNRNNINLDSYSSTSNATGSLMGIAVNNQLKEALLQRKKGDEPVLVDDSDSE